MKIGFIAFAILWLVLAFGYINNIYSLAAKDDFASPYKAEVLRGIGVFVPPVGVILGLFVTFDEEKADIPQ